MVEIIKLSLDVLESEADLGLLQHLKWSALL